MVAQSVGNKGTLAIKSKKQRAFFECDNVLSGINF